MMRCNHSYYNIFMISENIVWWKSQIDVESRQETQLMVVNLLFSIYMQGCGRKDYHYAANCIVFDKTHNT